MSDTLKIIEALESMGQATASELADRTQLPTMKVSTLLHYQVSKGQIFEAGIKSVGKHREVKLYSIKRPQVSAYYLARQTWYSPLLQ